MVIDNCQLGVSCSCVSSVFSIILVVGCSFNIKSCLIVTCFGSCVVLDYG